MGILHLICVLRRSYGSTLAADLWGRKSRSPHWCKATCPPCTNPPFTARGVLAPGVIALLAFIHPSIGQNTNLSRAAIVRINRPTAARANLDLNAVDIERKPHCPVNSVNHLMTQSVIHVAVHDQRKLIAANPKGKIGLAHTVAQSTRHRLEQLIAHVMPIRIIDGLKAIKVKIEQSEWLGLHLVPVQNTAKVPLIEQARKSISVRHGLELYPLANVLRYGQETRDHAVGPPFYRNDAEILVDVSASRAVLNFDNVIARPHHLAQSLGRKQICELGILGLGEDNVAGRDLLQQVCIITLWGILRLPFLILAVFVSTVDKIDHDKTIDDALHAAQQLANSSPLSLDRLPFLILKPRICALASDDYRYQQRRDNHADHSNGNRADELDLIHARIHDIGTHQADD